MSPLPINNDILRGWVSEQTPFSKTDDYRLVIKDDGEQKTYIGICGSGPFPCEVLRAFLKSLDFYVVDMNEDSDFRGLTLIIGENEWESDTLDDYLERALEWAAEINHPVRIYSQEMFLFWVMAGMDPFDADRSVLEEFGRGHPALDYLTTLGFDWPECKYFPSTSSGEGLDTDDWPGTSPLTALGYHVGKSGIADDNIRQRILERAFLGRLPIVGDSAYMKEWGSPNKAARLKKIAYKLANEIEKARRRSDDRELAIAHWKTDLVWLKRKFYTGRFRFQWPSY